MPQFLEPFRIIRSVSDYTAHSRLITPLRFLLATALKGRTPRASPRLASGHRMIRASTQSAKSRTLPRSPKSVSRMRFLPPLRSTLTGSGSSRLVFGGLRPESFLAVDQDAKHDASQRPGAIVDTRQGPGTADRPAGSGRPARCGVWVPMPRSYIWPASWKGRPFDGPVRAIGASRPDVGDIVGLQEVASRRGRSPTRSGRSTRVSSAQSETARAARIASSPGRFPPRASPRGRPAASRRSRTTRGKCPSAGDS